jgi:pyrimidine-specific ribonucleoside hydrolase
MRNSLIIALIFVPCWLISQTKSPLIIDSDAGTDDMRAIALLTNVNGYELKAITLSDGTLFPDKGAVRVTQLLQCLGVYNVMIGTGRKTMYNKPAWRKFAETVPWGSCIFKAPVVAEYPNAVQIIDKILTDAKPVSVTFVCLGSLNNIYETLLINPDGIHKIKQIIWYNSVNIKQGTNYLFDFKSADYVLSQPILVKIISSLPTNEVIYTKKFSDELKAINNTVAKEISYQLNYLQNQTDTVHILFRDEMVAIYLASSRLFTLRDNMEHPFIQLTQSYDKDAIHKAYLKLAAGKLMPDNDVVFSVFPIDSTYYQDDVLSIKDKVIAQYGENEFKAAVLTSEIHGHLGVYSIIGAKMGIYAMELLNAPNTSMPVHSYCGKQPPLSCMNDGIMVSTGSSPAYNLLMIDTTVSLPSAIFYYQNRSLKISLKDSLYKHIDKILQDAVLKYTISSSAYWDYVRQIALIEWLSLDRTKIFSVEELK